MTRRWAPPTRYMLRRMTASIMKDLILICLFYNKYNQLSCDSLFYSKDMADSQACCLSHPIKQETSEKRGNSAIISLGEVFDCLYAVRLTC